MHSSHNTSTKPTSSQFVVVALIVGVILALVGSSLHDASTAQASSDSERYGGSSQASSPGLIDGHIDAQKSTIADWLDSLVMGVETKSSELVGSGKDLLQEKLDTTITPSLHKSFAMLQNKLHDISCDDVFIVDADEATKTQVLKRGLEKCLITPSHSSKANPQDFLTNATLRTIASRAGFDVNMDYASDDLVTKEQFIGFLNDLQSQTQFGSLPVVSYGEYITREQFLYVLYKLFEKDYEHVGFSTGVVDDIVATTQPARDTKAEKVGFNKEALNDAWGSIQMLVASL